METQNLSDIEKGGLFFYSPLGPNVAIYNQAGYCIAHLANLLAILVEAIFFSGKPHSLYIYAKLEALYVASAPN